MSTRKRPLAESHSSQTPTRYAPSTPHAIRALQQRSGAKTRTVGRRRALSDTMRPESARGILRQLARLTAPATKKLVPTPAPAKDKENQAPEEDDEHGDERLQKRPRLTLDIDESLESIEAPEFNGDEDDSELPAAPTPSFLPDDDEHSQIAKDNPTFTLKSIDYAGNFPLPDLSRVSRRSFPASDPGVYHDDEEEPTILSERGRRAPTVEPTEVISHFDFGEFNQDDADPRQKPRSPDKQQLDSVNIDTSDMPLEDGGGETEALRNLQGLEKSPSLAPPDDSNVEIPSFVDNSNFQLPDLDLEAAAHQTRLDTAPKVAEASILDFEPDQYEDEGGWEDEPETEQAVQSVKPSETNEPVQTRPISAVTPKAASQTRRKKVKLTRHGEMVSSLPSSFIKRVAIEAQARLGNRRPNLGKDHMKALEQATEWYFEQVGEDLAAYSDHARRKKRIDKSDVLLLLRRQRLLQGGGELLKAAKEFLPKEVVAEMGLE